jgi:hypothetical protein
MKPATKTPPPSHNTNWQSSMDSTASTLRHLFDSKQLSDASFRLVTEKGNPELVHVHKLVAIVVLSSRRNEMVLRSFQDLCLLPEAPSLKLCSMEPRRRKTCPLRLTTYQLKSSKPCYGKLQEVGRRIQKYGVM